MKLTKLAQLQALPNGTRITDAAGRKWEVVRTPGLDYLYKKNGDRYTKWSLPYAARSGGPFHVKDNQ